jgi:cytochrome c
MRDWFSFPLFALAMALAALPVRADFIGHGGMVRAVAVSPDGTGVLTAGFDYTARTWDFATQQERRDLIGHDGPVNAAAFLPGGTRAVTAGNDGQVILWSLEDGRAEATLGHHDNRVLALAVSPDGRLVASAGWDRTVRLWDVAARKQVGKLRVAADATAVAFAVDGKTLFTGHKDGGVRVWRVADGTALAAYPHHDMGVTALAVPAPGRLLSSGIAGALRLWDTRAGKVLYELKGHDGPALSVAARPGTAQALSVGRDGKLIVWDLETGREVGAIAAHDGPAWAVAASPDGRFALTAGSDGSVRTWHVDTRARVGLPGEGADEPKPWLTSDHPGAQLYRTCAICHALTQDAGRRSGPHLAGLFGRPVGTVKGYPYSDALAGRDFRWNEDTLFKLFSLGPDKFLPGTKMPVQRIPDDAALHDLIAYLKELTR